jgi:hypothetical protein
MIGTNDAPVVWSKESATVKNFGEHEHLCLSLSKNFLHCGRRG